MFNTSKTKNILGASLLTATLLTTTAIAPAYASAKRADVSPKIEKQVEQKQYDKSAQKRKEIVNEARTALRETENALKSLDEGKTKEAIKALEEATGKLEIVLARDPSLKLAMVNAYASTNDLYTSIDLVKKIREEAEDALDDGRVQDARRLLSGLVSETVVKGVHIPLGTYPAAIKTAVSFIDEGNVKVAKQVLQTALNTLVITEEIIPIPVANAQLLLVEAEFLSEKKDRSYEDNKKLSSLLNGAKAELKFAEALGYGSKKDFKNLYEELENISERTDDGKSGKGLFGKIKSYLSDTTKSSQPKETTTKSTE